MMNTLFSQDIKVVNIGVESFGDNVRKCGAEALQLEWVPPAQGDIETAMALASLANDERVNQANEKAFNAYLSAQPALTGIGLAGEAISGMGERTILHAGPPIEWERMCGPVQGAIVGALLYEGWASDKQQALELAGSGEINYANVFRHIRDKGFDGIFGMEHGNSRPGAEGERAVIEAYRSVDPRA